MTRRRAGHEWVGGLFSVPSFVSGEGEPYRPEVIGSTVGRPGEMLPQASAGLREAMARPLCGRPHLPSHVRVALPALAEALRSGHPGIETVCGPMCAPWPHPLARFWQHRGRRGREARDSESEVSTDDRLEV